MNLKKLLTSAILLGTLAISCGTKTAEAPAEGLKGSIIVQAEDKWVPYYEAAIARVKEKNPDATIEIKTIASFDHIDIIDKTDATNTDVADVFAAPLDRMIGLVESETLASFDAKELANRIGGFDNFDSGLGGQLKFEDNYYGFPLNIETLILGLNAENAKAKGIDSASVDFAELGPEVAMMPVFNAWWGVGVTNGFGVELLGKDGDKFFSDLTKDFADQTPEVKAMFEGLFNYWKVSNEKKLPIFDISAAYGYMDDNFKTGKTGAARVIGPWEVAPLVEQNLKVSGLANAKFAGKELKHWKGGWALVINSRNEEDKDKLALSEALIAELLNPQFAADFYTATGKIMPNVSKEDYNKSSLSDLDKEVISAVIDSYEGAVSRPLFKEWGQVWDTWQNALVSWESKKPANAEEAYKEVQASFKALLTNLGQ